MNKRERQAMSLLKNLFDDYNSLPLKIRMQLRSEGFAKKIDEIPSALKLFKEDIGKEISVGVSVARINERFPLLDEEPRDNPLIGEDDSWIHDIDMGAR